MKLVQAVHLPPHKVSLVSVEIENMHKSDQPLFLEPSTEFTQKDSYLQMEHSLLTPASNGNVVVPLINSSGLAQTLEKGTRVGYASEVTVVAVDQFSTVCSDTALHQSVSVLSSVPPPQLSTGTSPPPEEDLSSQEPFVQSVSSTPVTQSPERLKKLAGMFAEVGPTLKWQDRDALHKLLLEMNCAFAVDDKELGSTDLVQMNINTGESEPKKQPVRRTPFAARQEVAKQLRDMQSQGVIQPSTSPWASPVVLVRKKDGSLRFCIDYRELNAVTKSDQFPLPRIDDLLDQLGKAKYFTTLDLAAGYWQVKMHPEAREKTAFITYQGLYEFNVMPFGLKNAPAVFQRLMQRVLMGLNPTDGSDFVTTYLDDILVFSSSFEEHLLHLQKVLDRLMEVGLKLKPAKCHFLCQSVEYLGHVITPEGISPNAQRITAVKNYPIPKSAKEVRQFLGLASYYRRFVLGFAKIAEPLHRLTQKGAVFAWNPDCQTAFDCLKSSLTEAPILAYPDFLKDFVLETDASVKGLGAVLSQHQNDGRLQPHCIRQPLSFSTRKKVWNH